jgi:hypothetical protein
MVPGARRGMDLSVGWRSLILPGRLCEEVRVSSLWEMIKESELSNLLEGWYSSNLLDVFDLES